MRFYSKNNVYQESIKRIEFLFDEFEEIVIGFSGGKDSTVTLFLALEVAEKKNRLPLNVLFIDQEAEWQGTIDYVKKIMYDKRVKPYWFQMPIVITNNASAFERYNYCWQEGKDKEWIRSKDEISIKKNIYNKNRFHDLFSSILEKEFKNKKTCYLSGVRTQEAPKRLIALTNSLTYKHITYGKILNKKMQHYTIYPIYDWQIKDVWKYIHDNNLEYCKIYDAMYSHGVKLQDMRISNLHHETAIQALLLVQEIEPKTWNKISTRISGSDTVKQLKDNAFRCPKELPYMFESWQEYIFHLADNLILEKKYRDKFYKYEKKYRKYCINNIVTKDIYTKLGDTILSADWDFTKLLNFNVNANFMQIKKYVDKNKLIDNYSRQYPKYIKEYL